MVGGVMAEQVRILLAHMTARIYTGISMIVLIIYTSLAIYEHFSGDDRWAVYFLMLGFGLSILFFLAAGRTMRKAFKEMKKEPQGE
jgi:hypothetical protein